MDKYGKNQPEKPQTWHFNHGTSMVLTGLGQATHGSKDEEVHDRNHQVENHWLILYPLYLD